MLRFIDRFARLELAALADSPRVPHREYLPFIVYAIILSLCPFLDHPQAPHKLATCSFVASSALYLRLFTLFFTFRRTQSSRYKRRSRRCQSIVGIPARMVDAGQFLFYVQAGPNDPILDIAGQVARFPKDEDPDG